MGKIFRFDSKFGQLMGKLMDCAALSLLWLVFCMPVFTAGAATTALYYTALKAIRKDTGYVVKEFWHAFKANFKQSTIVLAIAIALVIGWGVLCMTMYEHSGSNLTVAYIIYFVVLAFFAMWFHYIFSYIARFQDKLSTVFKNTLYICLSNFPYSLLTVTMFALVLFGLAATMPTSLWALLVLPAIYAILVSLILEPIYKKYLPGEEA